MDETAVRWHAERLHLEATGDRSDDAKRAAYDRYLHPRTRVPIAEVLADYPAAAELGD